jgi:hypothetical protein
VVVGKECQYGNYLDEKYLLLMTGIEALLAKFSCADEDKYLDLESVCPIVTHKY